MSQLANLSIPIETIVTVVLGVVGFFIVSLISIVGFFVTRHFTKTDGDRESIDRMQQQMGVLEAARQRAMEADVHCREAIADLQKEIQSARERLAAIEARGED